MLNNISIIIFLRRMIFLLVFFMTSYINKFTVKFLQ